MYTLTESDLSLLANIAGGFNYDRRYNGSPGRVDTSVLVLNMDAMNLLVERAKPTAPPADPGPFVDIGPLPVGVTRPHDFTPGVTYVAQAQGDGGFSVSVSDGSSLLYAGAGAPGEFTTSGAGATARIPVKAGQWVSMKLAEGMPAQAGRYDIF